MKPINRVQEIINYKHLSISAFEKATGMSNNSIQTAIKRNANLKDESLNVILNTYNDINPTWLLTGDEEMLRLNTKENNKLITKTMDLQKEIEFLRTSLNDKEELISMLKDKINTLESQINIYDTREGEQNKTS